MTKAHPKLVVAAYSSLYAPTLVEKENTPPAPSREQCSGHERLSHGARADPACQSAREKALPPVLPVVWIAPRAAAKTQDDTRP